MDHLVRCRTQPAVVLSALAGCVMALAACSGGGIAASGPPAAPGTPVAPGSSVASVPSAAPQAIDACSVLTDEEISAASGYGVLSKTPGHVMGVFANGCSWELDTAAEHIVSWTVDVGVISPGGRSWYDKFVGPLNTETISGLGDAAVREDAGGVTLVKGDSLLSLFVIAMGGEEERITRDLVETAVQRLP